MNRSISCYSIQLQMLNLQTAQKLRTFMYQSPNFQFISCFRTFQQDYSFLFQSYLFDQGVDRSILGIIPHRFVQNSNTFILLFSKTSSMFSSLISQKVRPFQEVFHGKTSPQSSQQGRYTLIALLNALKTAMLWYFQYSESFLTESEILMRKMYLFLEHIKHLLHQYVVLDIRNNALVSELEQFICGRFTISQIQAFNHFFQEPIQILLFLRMRNSQKLTTKVLISMRVVKWFVFQGMISLSWQEVRCFTATTNIYFYLADFYSYICYILSLVINSGIFNFESLGSSLQRNSYYNFFFSISSLLIIEMLSISELLLGGGIFDSIFQKNYLS